ncbi:unnamed protein product [Vitrella brassicaformis CCMP3155]|uniref:MYND-type domain-containing protein n=1 Tax=Vitrella brassicaformis (strain CCMP3155) TaxID=1169540 RepID=A0A0G4FJN0_VITBC|nr:unnamed protein product [Vitrella brassicaformis CCMP3155]|eukprot:CEM13898.1 unnamed protein product [Vitrella brassicaformis CCMP3155]
MSSGFIPSPNRPPPSSAPTCSPSERPGDHNLDSWRAGEARSLGESLSFPCAACGKKPEDVPDGVGVFPKCNRCKLVSYCGTECQRSDWPSHKDKCKMGKEEMARTVAGSYEYVLRWSHGHMDWLPFFEHMRRRQGFILGDICTFPTPPS